MGGAGILARRDTYPLRRGFRQNAHGLLLHRLCGGHKANALVGHTVERCAPPHFDRLDAARVPEMPGVVAVVARDLVELDDAHGATEDEGAHVEALVGDVLWFH